MQLAVYQYINRNFKMLIKSHKVFINAMFVRDFVRI